MNSPIRRFSTRFKALLDKGIDVQIVYHDTTDAAAAQRNSDEGRGPAHQRPEDHLPALEDQDPAQQVHRPAQERRRSGRSVDGLDQLHALRLPRPDQCRPSHRRRRHRQAVFRVLEGREDRSGTGRCARPGHGADPQPDRGDPGQVGRAGVLAAPQGRDARLVRTAHAQRRELGVVHGRVRHHGEAGAADRDQTRSDALRADGKADDRRRQEDADRGPRPRHPVLRRAARRTIHHEERQADGAQGRRGIRARQVVLRRRAVPAEERRLRVLHPYQVPAHRPAVGRPAGLFGFGQFLAALAHGERREHAADPRRHAGGRHLHDGVRSHLPPLLFPRYRRRACGKGR